VNYFKISLGIFLVLASSRFIPHPPNFTSLIALSFYVPAFFGIRFIPSVILAYFITDFFLGFHSLQFFTWGSVMIIGYYSKFLNQNLKSRLFGIFIGVIVFFILSNFGVFLQGGYGYELKGFILCYTLALPFLGNSLISSIIFSFLIEVVYKMPAVKEKLFLIK
jgi:hypothetical protein